VKDITDYSDFIMSSNQSSDLSNSLVDSAAIASSAYLLVNSASTEANKQVELSKVRSEGKIEMAKVELEREKLYTAEERLLASKNKQTERRNIQIEHLSYSLVRWSHERCSPIIPFSWASEREVDIMRHASTLFPSTVDKLPEVFANQKKTCGTSQQFHNIYKWLSVSIKNDSFHQK
jgi:hypothetical protein